MYIFIYSILDTIPHTNIVWEKVLYQLRIGIWYCLTIYNLLKSYLIFLINGIIILIGESF